MAVVVSLLAVGGVSGASAAQIPPPVARSTVTACVVRIAEYAFTPASVAEGDHTVLKLRARNCTNIEQDVTVTQYGLQPPGCAVLDPVARPVSIAPGGAYRLRSRMTAPSCPGTESMTVNITGASATLWATATANLFVS
jgi:hypothetical protein